MHDGAIPPEALRELGRDFEILGEVGRGAMAVVYRAREHASDREVAIKLIRARYIQDEETLARCAREAKTVMGLQHLNIVETFGARTLADGSLALIMEYVPGRTLRQLMREEGALAPERAAQVLIAVGRALVYAHEHGIIHRDIKPENICLNEETGAVLLSDFGLAKPIDSDTRITHTGATMGTPVYMSPEQIDALEVDERSDLYSLGMVGWEMLAGTRPWAGEGLYGVIYRQKNDELPALSGLRSDAPEPLIAAIEGSLRKDREERWESALDFLAQLDATADPYPARAAVRRRQRVLATVRAARETALPASTEGERTLRFRRGEAAAGARSPRARDPRLLRVAAAALLLLAGGAAAISVLSQQAWQPEEAEAALNRVEGPSFDAAENGSAESLMMTTSHVAEAPADAGEPAPALPAGAAGADEATSITPPPPAATPQQRPAPARARAPQQPTRRLAVIPGADTEVRYTSPRELPRPAAPGRRRSTTPDCQGGRFDPHDQHRTVDARCSIRLAVGESYQMRAAPGPLTTERRTPRTVSWSSSNPSVAAVDRDGVVKGLKPGGATISATAGEMGGTTTILVVAGAPTRPTILSGDGQAGAAGAGLPASLVARVTDAYGNPLSGVPVTWMVTSGGGLIQSAAARTDDAGVVRATWVLGRATGTQTASAAVAGLPPVTFTAVATADGDGSGR